MPSSRIIDISLELDPKHFRMRSYAGFRKDMQFEVEVIKEYDDPGMGQIVRGVHMRLHAGSHVDAPSHMDRNGKQIDELPLDTFFGDTVVADISHRVPGGAITVADLEEGAGDALKRGDRLLLRSGVNNTYDGGSKAWQARSPYLEHAAVHWLIARGIVLLGFDFYHGADAPDSNIEAFTARTLQEAGIVTLPYLRNLDHIRERRVTLVALPLKMIGVEASPVRAVVLED
jgi:arylformamidase